MAEKGESSIFNLSEEKLQSFEQVGPVKARAIMELLGKLDVEGKDVTVDQLVAIAPKTPWEELVESEKLCLKRLMFTSREINSFMMVMKSYCNSMANERRERVERDCLEKEEREKLEKERRMEILRERDERMLREQERKREDDERERERRIREDENKREIMENIDIGFEAFDTKYSGKLRGMNEGFTEVVKDMESRIIQIEINSQSSDSSKLIKELEKTKAPQDETEKVMKSISERIDNSTKGGVYNAVNLNDRPSRYSSYEKVRSTGSHLSYDRKYLDRDRSESPVRRKRSSSPAVPRMQMFSGSPDGLRFDTFFKRFCQIASRRGWDREKRLHRFIDCLTEQALDYALSSSDSDDFDMLVSSMTSRFDFREEPVIARQKLAILKQEAETEEQFLDKVQKLAHDGYDRYPTEENNVLLTRIIVETFLRGLKNKEAALYAAGRDPDNTKDALRLVKSFVANAKAFGVGKQVTFQQNAVSATIETQLLEALDKLSKGMERVEQKLEKGLRSSSPYNRTYSPSGNNTRSRSPNRNDNFNQRRYNSPSPRGDQGQGSFNRYSSPRSRNYSSPSRDDRFSKGDHSRNYSPRRYEDYRDRGYNRGDDRNYSPRRYDDSRDRGYNRGEDRSYQSRDRGLGNGQSRPQVNSAILTDDTLNSQELVENATRD